MAEIIQQTPRHSIQTHINLKLMNAIHYVISISDNHNLSIGPTLITKIIFLSELFYMDEWGETLTDAKIVKATYGPIPDGYELCLKKLQEDGKILVKKTLYKTNYINNVNCDTSCFSESALELLKSVAIYFSRNFTAKMLSDWTHLNEFWQLAEMGEEIPLYGFLPHRQVTPAEEDIAQALITAYQIGTPQEWDA
jgi:hypothetical protein